MTPSRPRPESTVQPWRTFSVRRSIALTLVALVWGCAPVPLRSAYQVSLPPLTASPREILCELDGRVASCTVLATPDYEALVRELKAACVALGGSDVECQTTDP